MTIVMPPSIKKSTGEKTKRKASVTKADRRVSSEKKEEPKYANLNEMVKKLNP